MAFNRLRDIRDRMQSKWTSGEFIFGYEDDINENHNIDYPLLLVIPPSSTLPATEKDPINAHIKEEYEFEVIFAKPYRTSGSNTGANDTNANLDVIYSLLEAEAYNWLQSFLDSYASKQVTLVPTPITVEREKNQQNDMVVQIRMGFTVDCFSHAFASFDDQMIRDLSPRVWLRSDVGVKTQYFGGKEVVSKWIDQSGNGNHFSQSTSALQPEYKYEMADSTNTENRHPYLNFDGTDDYLKCVTNDIGGDTRGLQGNHTIFHIAKLNDANVVTGSLLSNNAEELSYPQMRVEFRQNATDDVSFRASLQESATAGGTTHVAAYGAASLGDNLMVRYHAAHSTKLTVGMNGEEATTTEASYLNPSYYSSNFPLWIGSSRAGTDDFFKGSVQEILIFNQLLSIEQRAVVNNYLNHKYNIY